MEKVTENGICFGESFVLMRKKYNELDEFFRLGDLLRTQGGISLSKYYRIDGDCFENNNDHDAIVGDAVCCRVSGCGMNFVSVSQVLFIFSVLFYFLIK
jgi:hypothetical protein